MKIRDGPSGGPWTGFTGVVHGPRSMFCIRPSQSHGKIMECHGIAFQAWKSLGILKNMFWALKVTMTLHMFCKSCFYSVADCWKQKFEESVSQASKYAATGVFYAILDPFNPVD